jgi:hypothetical protein
MADKAMCFFVIFHIAAVIVILMHAIDNFDIATFESNAE